MGTFVKLKSADENTASRNGSEKTSAKSSTGGKFIKIGEPTFKKSYSTEQKPQTEQHSTAPAKEYDLSGEAWTRATASQTKLPSGYTSDQEKELSRLSRLRQDAAVNLDADTMNELDARMKAIRAEAGKQTFGDRVNDVLTSIGAGSMAAYANAVGYANNAIKDPDYNRRQIARLQESLNSGVLSDGKPVTPAIRETILQSIDRMNQEIAEWESEDSTTNRIYRVADRLGEESAKATESAKAGLGSVGGAVVDAAVSMGQSTLDALPAALTGGAAGMIPFVVRSFGGATQEARQSGADMDTQLLYGTAQAAKEYITEKVFGLTLPQKMMGKAGAGSLDGLIENGIRNAVSKIESDFGQKAVGGIATWLASGVTEGAEEAIGDWIENVFINPNFKTFERDNRTTQQKIEDAFYDFLVGGLSGLMGGVTNLVGYEPGPAKNSPAASPSSPSGSVSEQLIAAGVTAEEAEKLAPAIESVLNGEEISGNQAGSISRNEAAISVLETVTGEQIETDAPLSDVKEAIKALARRRSSVSDAGEATDTGSEADAIMRVIGGGKRVDHTTLTEEQLDAWNDHEDIWLDSEGKVYQMDPAQHISQRTYDSVGSQKVNAFQFDHPELRDFYKQAAEQLIKDASLSLDFPQTRRVERGTDGKRYINEILESPSLRSAMDLGLSRNDIIKAAQDLIADHGQENYAAAKRLELVLDDMLTDGYTTVEGESVGANDLYIRVKEGIPGYQATQREELPLFDMVETEKHSAMDNIQETKAQERNEDAIAYDLLRVKRAASVFGENGAKALTAAYDDTMARQYSLEDVVESFSQVYQSTLDGKPLSEYASRKSSALPEHLRIAAESAAQLDAMRAEQAKYFGEKSGLVRDANWKKAHLSSKTSRALDALGKALGVEVRFSEMVNDGQANAQYENGVITIALDAQDPVLTSLVHEIVHRVREASPLSYQTLAEFVQRNMSAEGMEFNLAQRQDLYGTDNVSYLTEEMVADAFGRMLDRDSVIQQFAQEHRSAAQKIADAISDIINAVKRVLNHQNLNLTKDQRDAFRDLKNRTTSMQLVFFDAIDSIEKQREPGEKKNAAQQDGDAKFSIKRTKSMTLSEQLKAFYDGKLRSSDALYFGDTPDALSASGLDTLPLVFTQADFKKSTKSKHNVPRRVLKNLNKDLETALFSFGIGDRAGILTGDIDGDGKPLLVGIQLGVQMDADKVNAIRSVYGLDNPAAWLKNQIDAGKTFTLLDEKRANTFLYPYGYLASRKEGIRSMGESLTQNGGEVKSKFSLKAPVEETKNLLAIHNKDEASILSALELGGLPMPSIAVVKAAEGHSQYGPISLVFGKDTIDPQADSRNKVYGSDAWTPTHSDARVDYEVDYDVKREFEQNIETLAKDVAGGIFSQSSVLDMAGVGDQTSMSVEEIAHRLATRYDSVRAAYLANKGHDINVVYRTKEFDSFGNDALKSYLDKVGEQEAARLAAKILTGERLSTEEVETVKDSIMKSWTAKNEWRLNKKPELRETRIAKQREKLSDLRAEDFARNAWDFYEDGGTTTDEVNRMETAENLRHAVDDKAVEAWVLDMLRGLTGEPGIYNGSELFDARGNRKSFKETHWSYTLENIVRAMNNAKTRGQGMWGMSGSGLVATATPAYNSVQEMHADESRLRTVDSAEYERMVKDLDGELSRVAADIMRTTEHHASNTFEEEEIIGDVIAMAAQGKRTTAGVKQTFRKEGYTISDKQAGAVLGVIEHASNVPTGYFEAKPQRAVGFDEVLAAVIPDDSSEKLRTGLERAGVRMLEYKSGDDADRLAKVNSVDGARFSLKTDSQGRTLTERQREYFKDSKAVDEQGRLMVMYHGTRKGGFTVFRDWSYLTDNRKYAERYMDRDTGETMYEVYANIRKPFDTRLEECRAIWENEFYGEYSRTALQESGLPDWTDGYDLVDFLEENGYDYDAILLDEGADQINGSVVERGISYVVRSSEQIKNVDNKTPTDNPDIRRSRKDQEALAEYVKKYGAIPKGETPSREIVMPRKTGDGKNLSKTVRTILEAGATPDEMIPSIEKLAARGDFSYDTYTDKQAISDAERGIKRVGWAQALSDWTDSMKSGEVSKKNTAMGWALYNNAANAGDTKTAITILEKMVEHQRNAAQALQATRILKKMSPETQLYQVQRSVESLQEELNDRFGEKNGPTLKIDQELAERFMQAKDQEERDAALRDIYRDIGRQMPSRFLDKWNAWRYLAMLGNPRTHVRNVFGNAGFAPVVVAKNLTATAIEEAVYRVSGGKLARSKSVVGFGKKDMALLSAAWSDYAKVQDTALSGGKYSDFSNANKYVEEGRVIFKTKALEKARKANSAALDSEDVWFSKPHYAYALAQYCKANGITAEQIESGKDLKKARAYAILEAQKATYRDTNAFSQTMSELGRSMRPGKNPVRKGISLAMEGILPFRKTPANILARGVEYSPLGLLNGIKQALLDVQRGKTTGAEAIDSISAGLTGTGLFSLGIYLAAQGLVRGHGGDDDKEKKFEEMMGHQAYSLELPNGTSITLDWLAPECLPFFVGVNLWEQTGGEKDAVTLSTILSSAATVSEPLLEMSCLQSLNDVFDAVGYASSDGLEGLPAALASAATSYLTQALPTVLGQAERTGEDRRYTTYTEKNAFLTADMQYTLGRASARIPVLDYQQIPYIDAWGRVEQTGDPGERAFNNFLNPAYTSSVDTSEMEQELLRLYRATGEESVLPSRAAKYFTVNGERKDLTAEEYIQYATLKGRTSYNLVSELTGSIQYQSMSEDERVDAVKNAYDLSNQQAKAAISNYKPDNWMEKSAEAEKKYGISQELYIALKTKTAGIQALKDKNGETIENSKGLQIMEMVYNTPGLTEKQRKAMFEYLGVGKTIRHYNKALVKEKLSKMRKSK